MEKRCVLDEAKLCDDCGECNVCDLDPNKICDNCMRCLKSDADYRAVEIDEIIVDDETTQTYLQLEEDLLETRDGEKPFECFEEK